MNVSRFGLHRLFTRRVVGIALIAASLALAVILLRQFVGEEQTAAQDGGPGSEAQGEGPGDPVTETGNMLLASNRSHLSICVDGAGDHVLTDADVEAIRSHAEDVLANAAEVPEVYGELEVSAGCPPADALDGKLKTQWDFPERVHVAGRPGDRPEPSQHLLFVYIVDGRAYSENFGALPGYRGPAEAICGFDDCLIVTTALYITPSLDPAAVREALTFLTPGEFFTPDEGETQ